MVSTDTNKENKPRRVGMNKENTYRGDSLRKDNFPNRKNLYW